MFESRFLNFRIETHHIREAVPRSRIVMRLTVHDIRASLAVKSKAESGSPGVRAMAWSLQNHLEVQVWWLILLILRKLWVERQEKPRYQICGNQLVYHAFPNVASPPPVYWRSFTQLYFVCLGKTRQIRANLQPGCVRSWNQPGLLFPGKFDSSVFPDERPQYNTRCQIRFVHNTALASA